MVTILRMVTIHFKAFFTLHEFGSQKFLPDRNLTLKNHYRTEIWLRTMRKQGGGAKNLSLYDKKWQF